MADTLLDAFVRVAVDPGSPVEQQLQDLVQRLQAQFGKIGKTLGETMAGGIAGGGGAGGGAIKKSVSGVQGLFKNMREEVLKFQKNVALVRIDIRPTGDKDLLKTLADIQNKVQAAQATAKQRGASRGEKGAALREVQQANEELQKLRADAQSLNAQSGTSGSGDTLKQQIFAARQEATGLRQEMQEVGRVVQQSRDAGLIESFRKAREEAGRLQVNVRDALSQADFLGADAALRGLQSLSQEFKKLQSGAQSRLNFDVELNLQDQKFKEELRKVNAELNFQSVVGSGSLSGANKVELARLRKEVELAELAIDNMNSELAKTPDLLQRLNAAKVRLLELKDGMVQVYQDATVANGSLNNLNNNMYQLGQAIEDFSVGFELNGLKGGIRGAANNVSFLVNNLGQALERSQFLNASWRSAIGLLSGVGAAIGILVIPRLVEWLRSLNDIEIKTEDISKKVEKLIRDAQIQIDLKIDTTDFRRSSDEVKTYTEALDLLIEKSKEAERAQTNVFGQFQALKAGDVIRDLDQVFIAVRNAGRKQSELLNKAINETIKIPVVGPLGDLQEQEFLPDAKTIANRFKAFKEFDDLFGEGFRKFVQASGELQRNTAKGIVDVESLKIVRDGIERITEKSNVLVDTLDISAADVEKIKKNLEEVIKPMQSMVEEAEKFRALNQEIEAQTLGNALAKVSQITAEYQFQLDVLEGRRSKEEEILFEQEQQTKELNRQLDLFKQLRTAQKADPGNTDKLIAATKETALRQQQIDLLKRIKELEEQDPGKSRRGSPDDFFVGVDAKSKEESSLEKELRLLREAVNKNRAELEGKNAAVAGGGVFAPRTTADKRADRRSTNLPEENERRRRARRGASEEARAAREKAIADEVRNKRFDRRQGREFSTGVDDQSGKRQQEIESNKLAREEKSRSEKQAIKDEAARKQAELKAISEERKKRRQEELDRRKSKLPADEAKPLTRDQQEAADQAELLRLQQERQRNRDESEKRKAEEKDRLRRSDEARIQERDDALNELRQRAQERADKSPGAQDTLDRIREIQERFNNQRARDLFKPVEKNPLDDPSVVKNQTEDAKRSAELAKAMKDGLPFTSETIEKLLEASNKTLEAINQGIAKFDTAARVS